MSSASEQPQETDTLLTSVLQDIDTLFPENELFQFFELPDKKEFEPTEEEEKVQTDVVASDLITLEDYKIGDYLELDPDNIVIKEGDSYILTTRSRIIQLIENHEAIFYPCVEQSDVFSVEPKNIYDFPLFWLRSVGGYNAIDAGDLFVKMKMSKHRVFVTKDVNVSFPISAAFSFVHNPGSDIVGVNHCQSGTNMKLITLFEGQLVDGIPPVTGGKRKRTNGRRRSRKRSLRKKSKSKSSRKHKITRKTRRKSRQ